MFCLIINSKANTNNNKYYSTDEGIISIMYHRFNENKHPSTNIQMDVFKKHVKIIKNLNYKFLNPNKFEETFNMEELALHNPGEKTVPNPVRESPVIPTEKPSPRRKKIWETKPAAKPKPKMEQ